MAPNQPTQLDAKTLTTIEEQLIADQKELEKQLEGLGYKQGRGFEPQYPEIGSKDDENAEEVAEFDTNLGIEQELSHRLRDIKKALERLKKKDGSYGVCNHCGKPIDIRRLLARPESGSCVECKERMMQS